MLFNVPHADRNKSGVYLIQNSIDGRVYVGATKELRRRFSQHLRLLKQGKHPNPGLQSLFNLHGLSTLDFRLIELCSPDLLRQRETHFIDFHQSASHLTGFNLVVKGWKRPAEIRLKLVGRPVSEETRAKIGSHQKGRKASPEALANLSAAQKARWANATEEKAEFRERMKQSATPATQQKRAAALKGVPKSEEARANMRAAARARSNTPEAQAKREQQFATPEAKAAFLEKMRQGREAKRSLK